MGENAERSHAAVALAHEYGVYKVSRALRLQYDALKIRLAQLENQGGEAGGGVAGFVEVDGGQLIGEGETSGAVLELLATDGARLVIRLPRREGVDVVGLADSFWRRGA